jgi:hypothetical protein
MQASLAIEQHCVQINIRDVPEKVCEELAARAALPAKSMQESLRAELERLAVRPSLDAWLQRAGKRERAAMTRISGKQILSSKGANRSCDLLLALQPPRLLHIQTPDVSDRSARHRS